MTNLPGQRNKMTNFLASTTIIQGFELPRKDNQC